jgi:PAS domain S-box-containing protein
MEFSGYTLEMLREGGEFALYRGRKHDDPVSVLVLAPVADRPAPVSLHRLDHELALAADLDPAWAVRPLALARHEGRTVLLLEDPGGEPLDRLLAPSLDLTRCLRLALGLATALGQLHRRGLLHKDLQPANVIVDALGSVRLTGFGIASRLPRERQAPAPPEVIAGTLAYMAPEQTGRMNRSIDARSDLYSLGVTFYEMLTGVLPFTAAEPLEWVHCHVARRPTPPEERRQEIPGALSALVMKLLAKTAEERYQTAAGLAADLRRCLAEWEAQGCIDPFPLGAHDASDRLLIPETLYGREPEIAVLLAAFDRVVKHGLPELVLVSGYSGIGKSSVVKELHPVLVPPRGLFASGKFDQYKRDIPYSTLAQAFQSLVRRLLAKSEADLSPWRDALCEALGSNGRLIIDLVPELELILGAQPPVAELSPTDAQRRFQLVFRRFISVFARPEHPLALFLDDLQWLDAATLDLVGDLLTQPDVHHLMLIGAYRENEVDPSHPLMGKLEAIRNAGAAIHEIRLAPLGREYVTQFVVDALHTDTERAAPLAQLVHEKTAGNPFFVIQFLHVLAEEDLLAFAHDQAQWVWDLDCIRAKGYTDNVVDLMVGRLTRLRADAQAALQQLACLGNAATVGTLSAIRSTTESEVHSVLEEAICAELLEWREGSYRFIHDRIQEAAYSLIPESSRAEAHLRIGRLFAAHTAAENREEAIFEIVNQLNRGAALVTSGEEREQLAELNLIAARRAKAAAAYASALAYLTAGAALLPEDSWEGRHELIFAFELNRAECEFLTGALAAAEERLAALSTRAENTVERATAACLRVDLYTTLGQSGRAIAVGLDYLRHLGIDWSAHPTDEDVRREYERTWSQLGGRTIEDLLELPLMTDPASLATMDVLIKIAPPTFFTEPNLYALAACWAVNLGLERGNSDGSCSAYVSLGLIAVERFGDYKAGFRFGEVGCDLTERRGLKRFQARTYMLFAAHLIPSARHIRAGREWLRRAFQIAIESGDLVAAGYSGMHLNENLLAAGDPLVEVEREAEHGLEFARKVPVRLAVDIITSQLGLVRTLRGLTRKFGSFDDEQFDELRTERRFSENPGLALAEFMYRIRKLQARFFAGEYAAAIEASERAQRLHPTSGWLITVRAADYHFYSALSRAASCDSAPVGERQQHLDALASHHTQLRVWGENCPENFENRAALVGAEIVRIEGRELDAERLYEQAIRSARANGFVHHEALANELAARFYAARGFEQIADLYLRNARHGYLRWGADGKVRQLDQLYPHLRQEVPSPDARGTIGAPIEHLELATVLKVSQAISGEIVLEKLIETLLRTAIEHAGAERGLLLLTRGAELRIQADANTSGSAVTIRLREAPVSAAELPESVVHYATRTKASVILDDASAPNPFSTDEYFRQTHARSVLCLPLVKQAQLVGALYLENTLTPRAFTADRIAVLELLASQAAISLENARLYADLQQENLERQRGEEALRRSEAYLAQAQRLSLTGSFGWQVSSGELFWSEETFRIFQYHPAMIPSVERVLARTHPEDVARVKQLIERASQEGNDFDYEHRLLMPDGSVKHVHVVAHALGEKSGSTEFVGAVMDITAHKEAEEAWRLAEQARQRAVLEERTRMAGEIHDGLGQAFTGILLQLGAAERLLTEEPERGQAHLASARELAREGLEEARRSVWALRPQALEEMDLARALERMTEQLQAAQTTRITFRLEGAPRPLRADVADQLLRMGQEALTNALRHAQASQIGVELTFTAGEMRLRVSDDGQGFATDAPSRKEGFGLTGLRERAGLIGARLSVDSQPGCGTRVELAWRFSSG